MEEWERNTYYYVKKKSIGRLIVHPIPLGTWVTYIVEIHTRNLLLFFPFPVYYLLLLYLECLCSVCTIFSLLPPSFALVSRDLWLQNTKTLNEREDEWILNQSTVFFLPNPNNFCYGFLEVLNTHYGVLESLKDFYLKICWNAFSIFALSARKLNSGKTGIWLYYFHL